MSKVQCPKCGGAGLQKKSNGDLEYCSTCHGSGYLSKQVVALAKKKHQTRRKDANESGNQGQFSATGLDALCVCGHTRGKHAAAGVHDCFGADGFGSCDNGCEKFRKKRTKPAPQERGMVCRKAADFNDSHNYEVFSDGKLVALLFRDPENREWYEDQMPGSPQTHYTERWRGSTQKEALATIKRRVAAATEYLDDIEKTMEEWDEELHKPS